MRRHAWIATLAIVAAIAIPATIWYGLGERQLRSEARALEEVELRAAAEQADDISSKLLARLDEIRDQETGRHYLDYWPEYLSRGESCESFLVRRSTIATARRTRDVVAYFQLDENGRITSPRPDTDLAAIELPDQPIQRNPEPPEYRVAVMAANAPGSDLTLPRADELAQLSQFRWQTGKWRGKPTLVGIRHVKTTTAHYMQGFVVDPACPARYLPKGQKGHIVPGGFRGRTSSDLGIAPALWHVTVDPGSAMARAKDRAARRREEFFRQYFAGVIGAGLAGVCVLVLVRRSDRLAQERSRFAAAAAHELRTPLAGIQLHGEMLAHALGNPAKAEAYARRISDEAARLSRVVTNVLNYARVEEKRLRVQLDRGDLGEAVRESLIMVEPLIERAGAPLTVTIDDDLPPVAFDLDAVQQIVRNLVENAEKYTRGAADRRIEVHVGSQSSQGRRWAALTVRDHGPGIPASMRRRLFRPFGRPDENTHSSGLGLGLSVVRSLTVAQGAEVEYDEAPGGGARFQVRFPAAPLA